MVGTSMIQLFLSKSVENVFKTVKMKFFPSCSVAFCTGSAFIIAPEYLSPLPLWDTDNVG